MSRIARRGLRTHRARNGRLQQLAGRFPLCPASRVPHLPHGRRSAAAVRHRGTLEFFFRPEGSDSYYNFECNCIGTLLVGHRRDRTQAEHAPAEVLRTVRRRATYPHAPLPETEGDNRWTLTLAIPAAALFRDRIAGWDGVQGAMNLYKCGDDLSCPHYLSWRPVGTPAPDFHRPEFFEPVFFEPKKQ